MKENRKTALIEMGKDGSFSVYTPDIEATIIGVYVADMLGNSAVRFTPDGKGTVLAKGCFARPSEPCFWRGRLYVADFGGTTLTVVEEAKKEACRSRPNVHR